MSCGCLTNAAPNISMGGVPRSFAPSRVINRNYNVKNCTSTKAVQPKKKACRRKCPLYRVIIKNYHSSFLTPVVEFNPEVCWASEDYYKSEGCSCNPRPGVRAPTEDIE